MSIPSLNPPLELADQLGAWRRSVEAKGREIACLFVGDSAPTVNMRLSFVAAI
jgi:hypothetical protein